MSWVNRAYVKAVELPDSDAVLKSLIEVAAPDRIDLGTHGMGTLKRHCAGQDQRSIPRSLRPPCPSKIR